MSHTNKAQGDLLYLAVKHSPFMESEEQTVTWLFV